MIFLLDDDKAHRSLIRRAVLKAGIEIPFLEAGSISEAKRILFAEQKDKLPALSLAVVDLNLGDGRGTEIVSLLRASDSYKHIRIIVLSTSQMEEDVTESREAGADAYMTKASDLLQFRKEIGEAVSNWLENPRTE
ncbi:MAG: response regulator [Bdellovibrionales bacterium]|nr:response regulator [Bdellovibrionales bacterium]